MKDLRFPRVRTVLWDRSNQGPAIHVHVSSFRKPQVCISVSGLHVIKQHAASSFDSQRITLFGNVVYDKDGQRVSILVDTAEENKMTPIQVPILISKSKKCVFPPEDYTKAVKNVFVHCGSSEPLEISKFFSILGKCFVQKNDGGLLETCLEFDVINSVTQIKVVPINSVPIMLTALSKDLASPMGWSNLHGQSRSGYVTMDHARKLVLMVDSDPKIFTLPLIGIWVSGVDSVCHPFVWAGCIRYLCNSNLQQRVCLPPSPFILVLYSRLQTKPEFYECSPLNADIKLYQMEIYSGVKTVQLGYQQDLLTIELNLLKYGIKKDKIDSAASRMVKAPGSKLEPVSSSDEMMPRSIPTPHQSKIPEAKFDVPEVSIIFSDSGHHPPSQTGSLTVSCPSLTANNFQQPPHLATPANCSSYTRMQNGAVVYTTPSTNHQLLQQGNRHMPPGYPANQNPQLKGYNNQPVPQPPLALNNPEYIQPRSHLPQAPYPSHHNLPSPSNVYLDQRTPPISGPYPRYSPYPPATYTSGPSQITTQGHYNNKNTSSQHPNPVFNSAHLVPVPCEGYPIVKSHVPQPVMPVPPSARHPMRSDAPRFPYCPNQNNPIGSVVRPPYPGTAIHPHASFQPQANGYPMQGQNQNLLNQNNSARPQMMDNNGYYYRPPYCATSHAVTSRPCLTTESTPVYSLEHSSASNIYRTNLGGDSIDRRPSEGSPEDINSCRASRDSGLSDSPDSGQDSEVQLSKVQWDNVPVEIYNLLMQQSAQLRDLKTQVQQLKLSQVSKSASDSTSQNTISTSTGTSLCDDTSNSLKSDKTCTVAVNTSFQYPGELPSPVERVETLSVSLQTSPVKFLTSQSERNSPQQKITPPPPPPPAKSTESRKWQSSQNQNGSFTAAMPDMSHEDLLAVARRLSVDRKSVDSFQSEMFVDLPSYQTSLFRSTESTNTDRLPSLSSSHSLVSASMCANMQHNTDSERDTDEEEDEEDTGDGNPQLANKPECYERLINNVKQLLQREDPKENVYTQDTQPDMTNGNQTNENYLLDETNRTRDNSLLYTDESFHRYDLNLVDCTFVPKINYTSMLLDSDTETSLEINSLALKYLKDDQLTQMAKLHKQGASSTRPLCQNVLLRQIMRNNPDTSEADISKYGMCVNNLTFATRKYMEKHHLIEADPKNDQRIIHDSTDPNSPLRESEQEGNHSNIFYKTLSPSSSPPLAFFNNKDRPRIIGPLAGAAGTFLPCNRFEPLSKSTPVLKPFPKIDTSPMENVFAPIQNPANEELDTENRILDIAKLKQLPKLL